MNFNIIFQLMTGTLNNELVWGFRTKFYTRFLFPPYVMYVLLFLLLYVESKEKSSSPIRFPFVP